MKKRRKSGKKGKLRKAAKICEKTEAEEANVDHETKRKLRRFMETPWQLKAKEPEGSKRLEMK